VGAVDGAGCWWVVTDIEKGGCSLIVNLWGWAAGGGEAWALRQRRIQAWWGVWLWGSVINTGWGYSSGNGTA